MLNNEYLKILKDPKFSDINVNFLEFWLIHPWLIMNPEAKPLTIVLRIHPLYITMFMTQTTKNSLKTNNKFMQFSEKLFQEK